MNGSSIGAEVLRKVNPNQTYSLGTDHKTFLVRIYTADNTVVYSYTMTPTEVNNTLKLAPYDSKQSCHPTTGMSVKIQKDKVACYMPYVLKFYKGTGASRTFLSDQIITLYSDSYNWDAWIPKQCTLVRPNLLLRFLAIFCILEALVIPEIVIRPPRGFLLKTRTLLSSFIS